MLQLQREFSGTVPVSDMKDSDIAVVMSWTEPNPEYVGRIVQRFGDILLTLGGSSSKSWDGIFNASRSYLFDCRVRILEDGETLVLKRS